MSAPQRSPVLEDAVTAALNHLKQAEVSLLDAVHPEHPNNAILLGAYAFLREAISALSKAV